MESTSTAHHKDNTNSDDTDIQKLRKEHINFINEIMNIKNIFSYDNTDSCLVKRYKEIARFDIDEQEYLPRFYNYNEAKEILEDKSIVERVMMKHPYLTEVRANKLLVKRKNKNDKNESAHSSEHELDRNVDEGDDDETDNKAPKNLDELLKENDDEMDDNFLNELNMETKGDNLEHLLGKIDGNEEDFL